MYVYHVADNRVVEISGQSVSAYTCTKDALYYATAEQQIYKTDYSGIDHESLYQCNQGTIHNLSSYLNILYFIEDQERVVFLDASTKNAYNIWAYKNLDCVFLLSTTQLIATTIDDDDYLYDTTSKTVTSISSIEANNMVTQAVLGTNPMAEPDASVMTSFSASSVTQENDITFPLTEYPATIYDSSVSSFYRPLSWFHVNGSEGCSTSNCKLYSQTGECEGFARYAHDAYMHMINNSVSYAAWDDNKHLGGTRRFDSDIYAIKTFFSSLKTGAYIRYGKDSDATPANGVHSVVFVSQDSGGIWVYECNQSYYENLSPAQIGGHAESYFGCGIHFQYYTFERLKKYNYVLHYVNHSFAETPVYDNTTYHNKGCEDCDGYVRQKHTNVATSYINTNNHRATFNCCGGNAATVAHTNVSTKFVNRNQHQTTYKCCNHSLSPVPHTGSVIYTEISSSKHSVRYSCCSGSVTEVHMFEYNENNQEECMLCGYIYNNLNSIEDEEII